MKRVSAGVLGDTDSAPSLRLAGNENGPPILSNSLLWAIPNEVPK